MKKKVSFWKQVLIVIGVIFLILIFLDVYFKWKDKRLTDEEKLLNLKKDHEKCKEGIKRASTNEKWIYLISRSIIAIILVVLNLMYFNFRFINFDLSTQLNFNEAIILSYSFVAFMIAGTPSKFVKLIRITIFNYRKRAHLGKLDIDKIEKEIAELDMKIKKQSHNSPKARPH